MWEKHTKLGHDVATRGSRNRGAMIGSHFTSILSSLLPLRLKSHNMLLLNTYK